MVAKNGRAVGGAHAGDVGEILDGDRQAGEPARLSLGRAPSAKELERAKAFLKDSPLSELCRALLNVNEFVYLD